MASVTREIVLPAERDETWRWLTDPGELSRWLAPEVELEPWEGGVVETSGEPDPRTGVVERLDENELLRIRWWPVEDEDAATTVEFELGDDPEGTRVRVTETEGVPAAPRGAAGARIRMMADPGVVFGALADDTRRTVFVRVAAGGQATASELARDLPVTRQAVAKHLSLLASAGLVESERVGRETRFHARSEPLSDAIDWMATVGARWDDRLARLAALAQP